MNLTSRFVRFAATCLVLTLAACGGGGGDGGGTPPAGTVVGAAGGTVLGPNGAKVEIPPGALAADTTIAIEATTAGSPALPGAFSALGQMFALTPHGTTFAVPVTVTLPFDPASMPAGRAAALFKTNAQNQWEPVIGAAFGTATVSAQITSFSWVQVGGLSRDDPIRTWSFITYPGDDGAATILPKPDGNGTVAVDETLNKIVTFGPAPPFDAAFGIGGVVARPADQLANGMVFSTPDGVTYGAFVEAPSGRMGTTEPIGSDARFDQRQSYVKRSSNASFTFTLTRVLVDAIDIIAGTQLPPVGLRLQGDVLLSVKAFKATPTGQQTFYHAAARASIRKSGGEFIPHAQDESYSRNHLWDRVENFDFRASDFEFEGCFGRRFMLVLKEPIPYTVDLSSVAVCEASTPAEQCEGFTVVSKVIASAFNHQGLAALSDCQASYVSAYLRDPQEIGGTTLSMTDLEPTNQPAPEPPDQVLVTPAACVPGPGPNAAAGLLQFDAASFTTDESAGAAVPTITVTRTGGSSGAVTATFTTSDGTAVRGTHYTAVNTTVFFGDGDAAPRAVNVPIIQNRVDEIDKTVNLTLSQPGGCAALGVQTAAVLTIRDDDAPAAQPSGLDPTFDTDGKASTTAFGGDRSGMALQADGKIVMVGGTFTDFVLARFNADGSPDTSFGVGGGRVITDMGSGLRQEEALAVAIQPDGKIVVVGHTAIDAAPPAPDLPPTFAIARYNSDGSLDTSFGTGGRVSGNVNGIARAVAIQPDGKIVLAGEFELQLSNGTFVSDFTVARFNANGSLDLAFGTSGTGQVATDIGGAANSARNLVLQPNGAIVVSGKPQCSQSGCDHTDVVRYNANGTLDTSFGSGGKLTLAGVEVGEGLVRQSDGKLVLAGGVTTATVPATARFVLMRLNADGAIDTSFGNAGTVDTAFTESALANGVALQADGKIVAVGTRAFSANPNFIVARYNANGSVDATFGSDGNLSIDFFGFTDAGENVLVQPDGKIVVGGLARGNVDGYGVARINP
jgi:uncharacterized delta-60 repeat protein